MNVGTKLASFGLILAGALGTGAVAGEVAGPLDTASDTEPKHEEHGDPPSDAPASTTQEETMPAGVLISQDGYTLVADDTTIDTTTNTTDPFTFRITGPDGTVVDQFLSRHERELHLILVGTDLGSYAHLHPARAADGTWSAQLPALAPGVYRAFADFAVPDGPELTLGVDLSVPGTPALAPLPPAQATSAVDGYEVALAGTPVAGESTELELTVGRDGQPVDDLEPYLGAFGHLVAIRGGDLAYLHVHPLGDEVDDAAARGGPAVRFAVHVPSPGDYRLFFDFSHGGTVHTAAFTVHVSAAGGGGGGAGHAAQEGGHG